MKAVSGIMLTLLLIGMLTLPVNVQLLRTKPRTWTVDDDGPADFHTIQDAINAASPRDTIFVHNGTYYEHVVVNKTVTLVGENKNTTVIDGNTTGTVVTVISNNININGFTIQSDNSPGNIGIHLDEAIGCNIIGNVIIGNWEGVKLTYSSSNTISGNTITDNWYFHGIHLVDSSSDNIISGNIVLSNHQGIYLDRSPRNTINDNIVANNRVGIYPSYSCNNVINGNTVTENLEFGIFILESASNVLRNNNLTANYYNFGIWGSTILRFIHDIDTSNTLNGRSIYYWVNEHDKQIPPDAGYVGVINCTNIIVRDLDLKENGEGVLFAYTRGSIIENVNVSKNWNGIYLLQSSDNTIRGNRIDTSTYINIYLSSSSRNIIYHNNFLGYFADQVISLNSFNVWDNGAEGNHWLDYWGEDENGDGIGDTPYIIDENNQDNYPLMSPYEYWSNPILGDINKDMKVDYKDLFQLTTTYGSTPEKPNWNPHADLNNDVLVDCKDLSILGTNYGKEWKYP